MQLTVAEPLGLFLSHRYKLANSELVFAQQGGGADLELAILIPHPCLQACTRHQTNTLGGGEAKPPGDPLAPPSETLVTGAPLSQ